MSASKSRSAGKSVKAAKTAKKVKTAKAAKPAKAVKAKKPAKIAKVTKKATASKATKKSASAKTTKPRVLVKEKIAQSGIDLLKKEFSVDVRLDMDQAQLKKEIKNYNAIIIRSSTRMTKEIIEAADQLKVIGRAGIGVDNVDVKAATKKGVIVANAPQSNIVAAAEHTIGLLLAQSRNIPQANASLKAGKWERSSFGGVELADKVLGVIGFGRIGVLVAQRARGLKMKVVAYDPYVSAARFAELGVEGADKIDDLYKQADFITVHLPKSPETLGFVDEAAFRKMKKGVRIINCARGGIVKEEALVKALKSGKVAGAAIDVFVKEPPVGNPLLDFDSVIATPHLGASTIEAQDRAGTIIAEQVAAALNNQFVSNAVNIAPVSPEEMNVVSPFLPLCEQLGRLITEIADGPLESFDITYQGALADYNTKLLTVAFFKGALEGRVEDTVNYVNAEGIAEERGIQVTESKKRQAVDFTNVITVVSSDKRGKLTVGGTTIGPKHRPRFVKIYRHDIDIEPGQYMAFFRYDDVPGMIGRVGTLLGSRGINIANMNVGRKKREGKAVMSVTLDKPIPTEVLKEIKAEPGFDDITFITFA
ncbi:MAG: phosphoglycerate dehydrogenase [Thermoleophilia bacterium]|nr:phosphoglycerate dehydrogenase [Thermoleophilia bacterium]